MRKVLAAVFGLFIASAPAYAQDYKPVDVNFGFGWAFPTGDFGNSFDAGWNGAAGVTFNLNPMIGIQAEYMYVRMDGPEKTISVVSNPIAGAVTNGILESNHHMHVGTFNLVARSNNSDRLVNGYGMAGGGVYGRTVEITSPSVGYTTYCDPYWYVCYPALVEVDRILGSRGSTDFGINFGGGITFGTDAKFYIEARWHYVMGPDFEPNVPANGGTVPTSLSTSASYFPITFGLRW